MRSTLALAAAIFASIVARPAAAEWREASTDHFLIYADSGESWIASFANRLERAASALDLLQPNRQPGTSKANRVVIYAVSGTNAVQKLCGRCGSVAGFYVPRVGHSVAFSARTTGSNAWDMTSDTVLFHEYAHHFLLSGEGVALPRWYNEGFAEFYSTVRVNRDGSVDLGLPAKHRAFNILNAGMKIEQVLESSAGTDGLSQDIFYGRSWALTHMLTFDKARRGQLNAYLVGLNSGKPNLVAAREAFGDLAVLQRNMENYVRGRMAGVRVIPEKVTPGAVALRVLTPGEAAMMPVRMQSDRGVSRAEAAGIVADARRRAALFASDAGTQVALAEAEYDAGNDAEAEAAADRALAARSDDIEALMYKGRVHVRRARAARSSDPKTWSAARSWLIKANKADPDAAEPLMLFYQSFAAAGQKPTANASAALYRALELSGQDPGVRVAAARQYVIDGRLAEARRTLLPLAYNPHVPAAANRFTRVVAAIDEKRSTAEILRLGVPEQSMDGEPAADPSTPDQPTP